jgi:hypothetical protein
MDCPQEEAKSMARAPVGRKMRGLHSVTWRTTGAIIIDRGPKHKLPEIRTRKDMSQQ